MSVLLRERPADLGTGGGGTPARRAVVRWAWRLFRHEWRQQLLVLALLTVAVAATVLGAAVATNAPPAKSLGFGTANHLVNLPGGDQHLAADIAAIGRGFGATDVIENQQIATGLVQGAQLRAQDPYGHFGRPMLALVSGRYPTGAGEVAMTGDLASSLNLHIGDDWQQGGRSLRLTGLVQNPQNLLDNFALVAPGQLGSPGLVTVLFDATPSSLAAFTFPAGVTPQTPHPPGGIDPGILVLVFAIFGSIFVGLVAVAGFTVLAQRRLRALGMLSSLGATDRNVRLVMVANGAVVGIVAALVGAALGLAGWFGYAPRLQVTAHHRIAASHLPWWLIVTAMVLAVVTSVLAARRPARAAARVSVVAALSGRPAPPKPVHRSALPGLVLLAGGLVMLVFCGGWGANSGMDSALELGGLLCTAIGLLLLAPVAITVLGTVARRTPVAVRLALRDLARYRARSGAALAAISFAVLIATMISLLATGRYADALDYFAPNLPANQLVVYTPDIGPGSAGPDSGDPGKAGGTAPANQLSAAELAQRAGAIATSLGSSDVLALDSTDATLGQMRSDGLRSYGGMVYVATPALLRHYGIDPAAIEPDTMFLTSRKGLAGTPNLRILYGDPTSPSGSQCCVVNPKIQTFNQLPTDASDPNLLVTAHAVDTLGLQMSPAAWLIQTHRPLSAAQINTARQSAVAAGMTIETKSQAPSLAQLRNYATGAGILLALGVLAMTVGLIRSETAGDLRTLAATGASSRIRRTVTSATAGALGLLGALLGTVVAYLATVAFFRSQLSERMSAVPVLDLVLVLVGLPVVAALGSWLLAGREPPAIAHQPLE